MLRTYVAGGVKKADSKAVVGGWRSGQRISDFRMRIVEGRGHGAWSMGKRKNRKAIIQKMEGRELKAKQNETEKGRGRQRTKYKSN
jgi:hypothetical protein